MCEISNYRDLKYHKQIATVLCISCGVVSVMKQYKYVIHVVRYVMCFTTSN